MQVPAQTRLVEAWIRVDAGQGNANTIRYLIGSDDKSIVYGQTTAAAQNAGAYLKIDLQQRLAETQNICRVRFWTDNGAGAANTGATTTTWSGGLVYE